MKFFSKWTQSDWGIKPEFVSPLGWQNAIFELSALEHHFTPSMHLLALARCMNAIYSEYKIVVLPSLTAKGAAAADSFLGADDLVPIFIYVLSKSDLRRPILYKEQMWGLCHPQQLIGESGYYLTVLESAIEFVKETDPTKSLSEQTFGAGDEEDIYMRDEASIGEAISVPKTTSSTGVTRDRTESNTSEVGKDEKRLSGSSTSGSRNSNSTTTPKAKSPTDIPDGKNNSSPYSFRPKKERGLQRQTFD
jgi:hypothetical protein